MKKILSNIIFTVVMCVFGYLVIANIQHVLYLNKYDTFDFNSKSMTDIKTNIKTLEENIDKISKLDTTVFDEEELNKIKDSFDTSLKNIKSNKLLTYEGVQKFYLRDLLIIDLSNQFSPAGKIPVLETLAKYDPSINDFLEVYKYEFLSNAYNSEANYIEVRYAYKYNTLDFFNAIMMEPTNTRIRSRVYKLSYFVIRENYLANLVLKIGGGNNE
ncbi:MAG TPA: hypothetical protein GXZ95_02175 [Mollicutes bacterium]|nr:hypothetical protein [Mollicutes bacterium]